MSHSASHIKGIIVIPIWKIGEMKKKLIHQESYSKYMNDLNKYFWLEQF